MKSAFSYFVVLLSQAIHFTSVDAQLLQDGGKHCRLVTFIPFTDVREGPEESLMEAGKEYYGYGSWPNASYLGKAAFSLMASAELARRHFNARDTSIVPNLPELVGDCDITIPGQEDNQNATSSVYWDSAYDRRTAVTQLLRLERGSYCAIIGPVNPRSSEGVSVLSENSKIPQILYDTIDTRLSRQEEYPTLARIIPEAEDFANTVAKFFKRDVWNRTHVGIVYDENDYGEQFENPLENWEDIFHYDTITEHIVEGDDESMTSALKEVTEAGFRTVVLVTDRPAYLTEVARIAESDEVVNNKGIRKSLLDPGHLWMINGDAVPPSMLDGMKYEVDSPMDKLLRGAAIFTNYDPFIYNGESDPFLQSWRNQDSDLVDYLNQIQPRDPTTGELFYEAAKTYFQDETPAIHSSFIYDAVMTAGISACKAQQQQQQEEEAIEESSGNKTDTFRSLHHEEILKSNFSGASGHVKFKYDEDDAQHSNSRDPIGVTFGMYNIRAGDTDTDNKRGYEAVLTHIYNNNNSVPDGAWSSVADAEFIFNDGTTSEPKPTVDDKDPHYLSKGIQTTGFFFCGLALFLIFITVIWIFAQRNTRLVKASQPEFLYLLCFGATLVGIASVFLSFDEDKGKTRNQLSAMCSTFPWFFVIGYLTMYCALFMKLWRLSKLMEMRKRVVDIKQVMLPFGVLLVCCIIVLIVWQVVDPFIWRRHGISLKPFMTYGECASENQLPYVVLLVAFLMSAVAMTAWFSWKMKDVQSELSEATWIFAGIFCHLQVWFLGIPIIYITDEVSRDAFYIMVVALNFIFSVSLVSLVVWPKIYCWARDKYFGGPSKPKTRINVSGGASTKVSGLSASNFNPSNSNPSNYATRGAHSSFNRKNTGESDANQSERVAQLEREKNEVEIKLQEALRLLEERETPQEQNPNASTDAFLEDGQQSGNREPRSNDNIERMEL